MARRYVRDARGRFASGSYQGQTSGRGSRLRAPGRSSVRGSTTRLAKPVGTIGGRPRPRPTGPQNGISPTGTLPKPKPQNAIRPTSGRKTGRPALGLKANAIRVYTPRTPMGRAAAAARQSVKKARGPRPEYRIGLPPSKLTIPELNLKIARKTAQEIANRNRRDTEGKVARFMLNGVRTNQDMKNARTLITRRAQRAAAAAARGSKPATKAGEIYDRQLAPILPKGKGKRAKNNLRPGPRNTQGPPKRKRRSRSRKPRP